VKCFGARSPLATTSETLFADVSLEAGSVMPLDTECEDLSRVLETNLVGPFRLTKIVAGSMALRGEGTIVHISSDASVAAYPRWGAYSVSKNKSINILPAWSPNDDEIAFVSQDRGEPQPGVPIARERAAGLWAVNAAGRERLVYDAKQNGMPAGAAWNLEGTHLAYSLADAHLAIAELDLNPVMVSAAGAAVVDARVRVAPPAVQPVFPAVGR